MKNKIRYVILVGIFVLAVLAIPGSNDMKEYVWKAAGSPVVVLDPGHGGIDGGAEGKDGTAEKDINLNIALSLKKMLEKDGVTVIMTRETDKSLGEDVPGAIRSIKTADLHARKKLIDESDAQLTVSIHLNSFTQDSSVKGAQVFYPAGGSKSLKKDNKRAAELIQEGLNKSVNTDKKRIAMEKSDVYLLVNNENPIVIVECGFLSNPEDLENLKNKKHQEIISKSLETSIFKYLREKSRS